MQYFKQSRVGQLTSERDEITFGVKKVVFEAFRKFDVNDTLDGRHKSVLRKFQDSNLIRKKYGPKMSAQEAYIRESLRDHPYGHLDTIKVTESARGVNYTLVFWPILDEVSIVIEANVKFDEIELPDDSERIDHHWFKKSLSRFLVKINDYLFRKKVVTQ